MLYYTNTRINVQVLEQGFMMMCTFVCDHDVVIVTVSDTQHVRSDTVTGTGLHKALHSIVVLE